LSWHDLLRGRDCKTGTSEIVKPAFTAWVPTLSFWALPARPIAPALTPAPPTSGISVDVVSRGMSQRKCYT